MVNNVLDGLLQIFFVFLILALIVGLVFAIYALITPTEVPVVETVSFQCTITKMDFTKSYSSTHGSHTSYIMTIANEEFAEIIKLTAEQYAKFNVGDIIEVHRETSTYCNGAVVTRYYIS